MLGSSYSAYLFLGVLHRHAHYAKRLSSLPMPVALPATLPDTGCCPQHRPGQGGHTGPELQDILGPGAAAGLELAMTAAVARLASSIAGAITDGGPIKRHTINNCSHNCSPATVVIHTPVHIPL